jgi:hypothetical protein
MCGLSWAEDGGFHGLPLGIDLANPSDGSDSGYVRIIDDDVLEPQRFTIEAWIHPLGPGYGREPVIIAKPREDFAGNFIFSWLMMWRPADEEVWVYVTQTMGSANGGAYILGSDPVPVGTTSHVAMTFDGTYLRLFINGVEDAASPEITGFDVVDYGDQDVLIGAANFASPYVRRFDGVIDEVRIWDHALGEAEIAAQMDCALTGTEPGLLAYYSFNSGDAWDDSGQGHNGVVEGTADYVEFSQDCMILFDDFESGDTTAWSTVVP